MLGGIVEIEAAIEPLALVDGDIKLKWVAAAARRVRPGGISHWRSAAAVRGEVLKLARLLGRDPDSFAYLERLDPDDLRQLREQATEMLFSAHAGTSLAVLTLLFAGAAELLARVGRGVHALAYAVGSGVTALVSAR